MTGISSGRAATMTALFGAAALAVMIVPTDADAYDMDCKVILCLAGGFPSGCGDAYSYMVDRITDTPPKPPFGTCLMSNGSGYSNYDASYRFLNRWNSSGWDCDGEEERLHFSRSDRDDDDDDGGSSIIGRIGGSQDAFCYTHTTTKRVREDSDDGDGPEWRTITVYEGKTPAHAVNFEIQITVEPGTQVAYSSELMRLNYHTGYIAYKPVY